MVQYFHEGLWFLLLEDLGTGDVWNWVKNETHPFPQSLALVLESRPPPNLSLASLNLSCPPILGTSTLLLS